VRYVFQRLAQLLIVFLLVTFGVLIVMRIGSGSANELGLRMLGGQASDTQVAEVISRYHLDSNYVVQYLYWLRDLVTGDLGYSQINNMDVTQLLTPLVMVTTLLGLYAIIFGVIIAVPVAVHQAYRRDGWFDRIASLSTFVIVGVPTIVLSVLLKLMFNTRLGWFPAIGDKIYPWQDLGGHFKNFFLPALTLTLPIAAIYARLLRADMSLTLQADFITLASAKGVPPRQVLWKHALRNSLFSIVTAIGTQLGALVGSAIVVETFFDLDGLGGRLIRAVLTRDLFTVQSLVAVIVLLVVLVNFGVDLLYAVLDPRIRQVRALG